MICDRIVDYENNRISRNINVPLKVMDKEVFWETILSEKGLKLQKNTVTGHSRIINTCGIRIAWGSYKKMADIMERLIKPWLACRKGDILAVQRFGGVYSHYAVYVGNGQIIHYAQEFVDGKADLCKIHKANFDEFLKNETQYEIIHFPEDGSNPIHECINLNNDSTCKAYEITHIRPDVKAAIRNHKGYHLYSAQETVERAKSRIGETEYNLAFNNCEHFALWCKTGLKESSQVDEFWKLFWIGKSKTIVAGEEKNLSYV